MCKRPLSSQRDVINVGDKQETVFNLTERSFGSERVKIKVWGEVWRRGSSVK